MSLETVQFVGPIFVTAASIISFVMLVAGALGDLDPGEGKGERKG